MTADQQDTVVLGYLKSHFAATCSSIDTGTIAARTALQFRATQQSIERLRESGQIDAILSADPESPYVVLSVR
jgi:hypothetical protein